MSGKLSLFEGYGIELEYMIVRRSDLSVAPIADELMKDIAGAYVSDVDDGDISWSNELVGHVIEFKTSQPVATLSGIDSSFHRSALKANSILSRIADTPALIMPTAMHPYMNPDTDTYLWRHDNNEVYEAYNRIFDCRGHGWSNLQSMHINLPFQGDEEFKKLHTAIRFILPILPSLAASSPVVDGKLTGAKDSRLLYYLQNQKRIPSIAGHVIPEPVHSIQEYQDRILSPMFSDIIPFDPNGILRGDWLNSRGAIARFDRQSIEIRVLDVQECPKADLAIAELICASLQLLVEERFATIDDLLQIDTIPMRRQFDESCILAESASILVPEYSRIFDLHEENGTVQDIWRFLFNCAKKENRLSDSHAKTMADILNLGSLSTRIVSSLGGNPTRERIQETYFLLCNCLANNSLFQLSSDEMASTGPPVLDLDSVQAMVKI